jgi:hypothetical protein
MHAESLVIIVIVAIATAGRIWQIVFAYRMAAARSRERQRQRAERELFERLERCMQSDRVE